ncbi:MAG: phosphoribosyltransferase domain-containing protein [Candidatus Omnitrophica bacterium]|nr:phosphoribosyltransferase domain-containing protein [Candidatus Omnitrophota bacterium]MBU1996978.1 phosphoribosyltransferase domain-containing protein [Candidatus Omnitrophota bacterium]MBU4333134.1 phosphoribosyltransferase domain-containing protein [Candidatus Omnitrophota bacterium]
MIELSFTEVFNSLTNLNIVDVDHIVAIGQGGLIPASIVAYNLNLSLSSIHINYRDSKNSPIFEEPKLLMPFNISNKFRKILLVDDAVVSGKTILAAKYLLKDFDVKTMALIGNADYVVFPDIKSCVKWPWKVS